MSCLLDLKPLCSQTYTKKIIVSLVVTGLLSPSGPERGVISLDPLKPLLGEKLW